MVLVEEEEELGSRVAAEVLWAEEWVQMSPALGLSPAPRQLLWSLHLSPPLVAAILPLP